MDEHVSSLSASSPPLVLIATVLAGGFDVHISATYADKSVTTLTEYDVVVEGNSATCYVQSTPRSTFEISLARTARSEHDITAKVHLDGEDKRSVSRVLRSKERTTKMLGRRVSATEVRLFEFKPITTTERDADSFGPVAEVAPELGSIAIKIYRGTAKENTVYFSTDRDDPVCSFDELAVKKKSTTEAVGLATVPTPAVQARVRAFDYLDPPGEPPFQIFTFIYRSRAVLLARGIIKDFSQVSSIAPSHPRVATSSSGPRDVVEIIDSSDEEEEESQVVKDARAVVARAKREASIAEAALKAAKAASQHASASRAAAAQPSQPKRPRPAAAAPPATILKKSKIVKQEP